MKPEVVEYVVIVALILILAVVIGLSMYRSGRDEGAKSCPVPKGDSIPSPRSDV